jgi:Cytochrome P460
MLAELSATALLLSGIGAGSMEQAPVRTAANGIPAYVDGYAKWPRLNRVPIRAGSSAHQGTKNVYASKRKTSARYPVGTIVVKAGTEPGKKWLALVATMRKIKGTKNGGWRWEEFTRSSPTARFVKIGFPESSCAACHSQAKSNDFVFTGR